MPSLCLQAPRILIPKCEDNEILRHVAGYRAISLCNVDYKLSGQGLANRTQCATSNLVDEPKTCGIRGRIISSNVRIASCVLYVCDADIYPVAMLQIDLEKAFDRAGPDVLFEGLESVFLGEAILQGVRMAYNEC